MRQKHKLGKLASGMSLVELMIALAVLLTGVLGSLILLTVTIGSNFRNRQDSNSAVIAQMVLEKIRSAGNSAAALTLNDCAGNANSITTVGSATGIGAQLLANGSADFTQAAGSAGDPAGYYMLYTDCGTAGRQITYDVRWRIVTPASSKVRQITVSARLKSAGNDSRIFALPATVRSVLGP